MSIDLRYYFLNPEKFPIEGFLDGLKTPTDILVKAKAYLKQTLEDTGVQENKGTLKCGKLNAVGAYSIGEGTVIYGDVTIIGPVYVGKNCEILPGAVLRPYTIVGDGCNVGHGSEVKHTVMFGGSKVASLAFVGDSVLGASARVGSGVITANRKFNQSNATLKLDGVQHDLGDSFYGVVLGDASRLGANAVTQPGTHIGPYTWIFPMTNVRGFIPREKRVYAETQLHFDDNEIVELKP